MRSLLVLPMILAAAAVSAQDTKPVGPQAASVLPDALQEREQIDPRQNQKVERIRHEDAGSRIDETRYGGQTQSITVQPKTGMPAYEVDAAPLSRSRPADHRDGMSSAGGRRSWNVLSF